MQWKRPASFIAVAVLAAAVVVACDSPTSSSPDDQIHETVNDEDFGRAQVRYVYDESGETDIAALFILIPPTGYEITADGDLAETDGDTLEDPEDFENLEGPLVAIQLTDQEHDDSFKQPFEVHDIFSDSQAGVTWAGGTYTALGGFEFDLEDEFDIPDEDEVAFSPIDDAYFFLDGEVEIKEKPGLSENGEAPEGNLHLEGDVTLGEMDLEAGGDPQPGEAGTLNFTYDSEADFLPAD